MGSIARQDVTTPVEHEAPKTDAAGLVAVIERVAMSPDVDVAKLQAIVELQKDVLRYQAEAAFNAAFAEMQAEIPTVAEKGTSNNGRYALLEDVVEAVRPVLQRHGFSLSFKTEWPEAGKVKVVGLLTHREGHKRESEFLTGADNSGNKNAIQSLGSALSYGRRYTTMDLLNIVSRGQDDDGRKTERTEKPAPEGYDAWFATLEGLADAGAKAFDEGWLKSPEPFRKYLAETAPKMLAALKTRARRVKP